MDIKYIGPIGEDVIGRTIHRYETMIEGRLAAVNVAIPLAIAFEDVQPGVQSRVAKACFDLGVRTWFADDRNRPAEDFDTLSVAAQCTWRDAYKQRVGGAEVRCT